MQVCRKPACLIVLIVFILHYIITQLQQDLSSDSVVDIDPNVLQAYMLYLHL